MKHLAIFPARGGSKRIPKKNIRDFHGKPILSWPIQAAIKSGLFSEIIVSTDDNEIADVAMQVGATIVIRRPHHLADDYTTTVPVIQHAIGCLGLNMPQDYTVTCIYPTTPFLEPGMLSDSIELFLSSDCEFVFSACEFEHPIQRALKFDNGTCHPVQETMINMRTQDLEKTYFDAAQFYTSDASGWLTTENIFMKKCSAIILDKNSAHDIDDVYDWKFAEKLFDWKRRAQN